MIQRPPRSTQSRSSAASDVYKRQDRTTTKLFGRLLYVLVKSPASLSKVFESTSSKYPVSKSLTLALWQMLRLRLINQAVVFNDEPSNYVFEVYEDSKLVQVNISNFVEDPVLLFQMAHSSWRSCLLYTSPSPRDRQKSRMPSSA
eukprot:TRINITY_DN17040_c0_g1_i1.p1 TRINITY_DN17040_c0_g1~~TRINITY_DN17040_c0_g1_i1.p1  ORF type:complete len:145 (-),score=17.17 TRINITY_DN17040_c0_g1_i1:11-445(-)